MITVLLTHGSRINTDRSPTSRAFRGHGPQGNFLDFNSLKVPFPGFLSHSDRILTDHPNHYPDFDLESLKFFTKNIFIMKNLTDFRKTVETSMDPHLLL